MRMELWFTPGLTAGPAGIWFAALLDASLKGLILLLCAAAAAIALRRASAAARHLVWGLAFGGLLALPLLSSMLPAWRVPLLPGASPDEWVSRARVAGMPMATAEHTFESSRREAASAARPRSDLHWTPLALGIWLAGALGVLATLLFGIGRVWWLGRRARPLTSGPWAALMERLRADLGLNRRVRLLESDRSAMPMTWGIFRPVVLLPSTAADWPAFRQEAVLRHELAHVQRRDPLTQLAAELACALYWFNPLVWLAVRRLRIEREHACDDRVLRAGSKASDYASQLLDTARSLKAARGTSLAAVAMARRSQLTGRLLAVLDENRSRGAVSRRLAVPASVAAAVLILPLAALSPVGRGPEPELVNGNGLPGAPPEPFRQAAGAGGGRTNPDAEQLAISDRITEVVTEVAYATEVESEQEIQTVARDLAGYDRRVELTTRRLHRLFDLPGVGLYLQFDHSDRPFNVVLEPLTPSDPLKIVMPAGAGVTLWTGPDPTTAQDPFIGVFWVENGKQDSYTFRVPEYVSHITIVANGRAIKVAHPLERLREPVTFRMR